MTLASTRLTPQDVIRRFCQLHAEVARAIDPMADAPADCFCGEDGFHHARDSRNYRNELRAVKFIERATAAALTRERTAME